jgi:two-component system sensor histidine kinase DesK
VPYAWLVYLSALFIEPVIRGRAYEHWPVTLAGALMFLVAYFRSYWEHGRRLLPIIAVEAALGIGFSFVNFGAGVFFVYASAAAGQLDRSREAVRLIVILTAIGLATALVAGVPMEFWLPGLVFTPLIGGVNLHFREVGRANASLRRAQEEIAHLATVAERERIARDLHDVLGHTLSLISLKAELASKIAERDPQRSAREIRDVERVARKALADVRETIRGFRPTLGDEIVRARSLLDAAGIRADLRCDAEDLDPARDETLAFALREAVTNAVRHSGASFCRARVEASPSACSLVVEDDGVSDAGREGNGRRGMRERIEALGGVVTYGGRSGLRLTATIPMVSPVESTKLRSVG